MLPVTNHSFNRIIDSIDQVFASSHIFKAELRKRLSEHNYPTGSRLLNFKQTQSELWFLLDGLVREIHVDPVTLIEHTSWFWNDGGLICAEPGFFSQEPSEKTIEVLWDCRVATISFVDLMSLKNEFPETEMVTERLRSVYTRQRQRFVDELLDRSTDERYLSHRDHLEDLFLRTKVKYIAEYMGMTADTLGKLRKLYIR